MPFWLVLIWKAIDFVDTASAPFDWGKPVWDFVSNDENTWLFVVVAFLGLMLVVIWPDLVEKWKEVRNPNSTRDNLSDVRTGEVRHNATPSASQVDDEDGSIAVTILRQETLPPEAALMLEIFEAVEPQTRIIQLDIEITVERDLTPISFARLWLDGKPLYPQTFSSGRFSVHMQLLPLYFELPHGFPAGKHAARLEILWGHLPRWDDWEFPLYLDAAVDPTAEPDSEGRSI